MDGILHTAAFYAALGLGIFWLSFTAALGWHAGRRQAAKWFGPVHVAHTHRTIFPEKTVAELLGSVRPVVRKRFGFFDLPSTPPEQGEAS